MAQADWTFGTDGGSYSIVVDPTSPGSNTDVIDINQQLGAGNITVGNITDASIEAYAKPNLETFAAFGFILRASNFDVNPSTKVKLLIQPQAGAFNISVIIFGNIVIGSLTGFAPLTGTNLDWQKWRFSAFNSGGASTYVRVELWDGAAYVAILDTVTTDATTFAASGTCNFYAAGTQPTAHTRFDDVKIYTLA